VVGWWGDGVGRSSEWWGDGVMVWGVVVSGGVMVWGVVVSGGVMVWGGVGVVRGVGLGSTMIALPVGSMVPSSLWILAPS
jgi:hypothetical protein